MKQLILMISLLVMVLGCSQTRHTTFTRLPDGTVVKTSETEHWVFWANEKFGNLYYMRDGTSVHVEMGDVEITPMEIYMSGFKVGRGTQ